jgi:hypothetical protein
MTDVLNKKIRLWHLLSLPDTWFELICPYTWSIKRNAVNSKTYGAAFAHFCIHVAIYFFDRRYIDEAVEKVDINQLPIDCQWRLCVAAGLAYYDMGYRDDGINYLEQAILVADNDKYRSVNPYLAIGFRLNSTRYRVKRLDLALRVESLFPKDNAIKSVLVKSYIDNHLFDKAEDVIKTLIDSHAGYRVHEADLRFAEGNYAFAAELFEKYKLNDSDYFWRAQYDYKEAVSFFKIGQTEKWQNKAMTIGRRLAWDKFYSLDYLEDEGIQRIEEIDKEIDASRNQKRWIYPDKLLLILTRIPWMIWQFFWIYRYAILFYLVGFVFIGMLIRAFLKS